MSFFVPFLSPLRLIFLELQAYSFNEESTASAPICLQFYLTFSGKEFFFSLKNVTVRPTKIMNIADKNWAQF